MADFKQQVETVQQWLTEIQQSQTTDNAASEHLLSIVTEMIYRGSTYSPAVPILDAAPYEQKAQDQTQSTILAEANASLQKQMNELLIILQSRVAEISRLNLLLQEQIRETRQTQVAEHEQRAVMEALRETVSTMSSTLDIDEVLDHILDTVGRVTPYDGANVLFVESDLVHVVSQRGYVDKQAEAEWLKQRIPVAKLAALQQLIEIGKSVAIPDISASNLWIGFPGQDWIHSNVIAPIRLKDEVLGFLSLDSATRGFFTEVHAERLQAFADQAAIAIQNSRLYERAKRAAVQEERNRLTNELHDTISQTLWSVSLITERLPAIWARDAEEGQRGLETLHELAESALAEMRALLLELRPSVFMDAKLGELIQQFAAVIGIRSGLIVSVEIKEQEPVPAPVQVALYRVVQEALNNVVRHAFATRVEIYLNSQAEQLDLSICDDGRGFNPDLIAFGHLGLSIMKDRIKTIGATIKVIADPGGTCIKVFWKVPAE